MIMEIEEKLQSLKNNLHGKKFIVAFSGGADSTLLAIIAREVAEEFLAVTVDNGVMPSECIENAEKMARKIGINHQVIRENFIEDRAFRSNPPNRCYICKSKMYHQLEKLAEDHQYDFVADGTNLSDLLEDRPGIVVNLEKNIKTPLVQVGFTSDEVRKVLENLGWEYNPSTTCFATRISTGSEITPKKISRISYAENLIRNLTGVKLVRVREDQELALIEVDEVDKLLKGSVLDHIDSELKAVGFKKVTMDIGGYGSRKMDMVVYKPCKDEKNKIMFETELPYQINIPETCQELEKWGKVKCSSEMGIVMMEVEGRNVTVFGKGKIVARRVQDRQDAQELLAKVLPRIRRQL
jgi:uncharacterized protein